MTTKETHTPEQIFSIGINFKKADLVTRGKFSLSSEQQTQLLEAAKTNFQDFVVLSTCNRTEIYGTGNVDLAIDLLLEKTNQSKSIFHEVGFVKTSQDAMKHVYNVSSGLDSQILGDYEVLGQFKDACKNAKQHNLLSTYFERLSNSAITASKKVKSETEMSKGTVSVSYAAIEFIKEKFENKETNILIVGMGKFGRSVAKNIHYYLPQSNVTVANRTYHKAVSFATEFNFNFLELDIALKKLTNFDVIIVAVNHNENYIIDHKYFHSEKSQLVIDLSVPSSIDIRVKSFDNIQYINIDDVSTHIDSTLEKRKSYIPFAESIINSEINEFIKWSNLHQHRAIIIEAKEKLSKLANMCPHLNHIPIEEKEKKINNTISVLVSELQKNGKPVAYKELENYFLSNTHSVGSH